MRLLRFVMARLVFDQVADFFGRGKVGDFASEDRGDKRDDDLGRFQLRLSGGRNCRLYGSGVGVEGSLSVRPSRPSSGSALFDLEDFLILEVEDSAASGNVVELENSDLVGNRGIQVLLRGLAHGWRGRRRLGREGPSQVEQAGELLSRCQLVLAQLFIDSYDGGTHTGVGLCAVQVRCAHSHGQFEDGGVECFDDTLLRIQGRAVEAESGLYGSGDRDSDNGFFFGFGGRCGFGGYCYFRHIGR